MSTAQTSAALAAGTDTSRPVPKAQGGAQRCIRRQGSVWTQCQCDPCRRQQLRNSKLHQAGLLKMPDHQAAALRLQTWLDRGLQPSAIASAIGLSIPATWQIVYRQRQGAGLQSSTVHRILTAREPTSGRLEATGTRRRLQGLAWMGWSLDDLHERTGVSVMSLSRVRSGVSTVLSMRAATAVRETYQQLQNAQGPSKQAATFARAKGWAPPAAWDDELIDDPAVQPQGVALEETRARLANDPAVIDEVRVLLAGGYTDQQIAYRVGLTTSGVQKLRTRHNLRRTA